MTEQTEQTTYRQDTGFDERASEQPTSREAGSENRAEQIQQDDRADGADSAAAQGAVGPAETPGTTEAEDERTPLFATDDADRYRQRWESLQARFVDQPRETVAEADNLVSGMMKQLTAGFSDRRASLEVQWEQGDQISTEELRVTLTRYRSFFNRLLSV
jgi:hypothetical protein